MRIWLLQIGEVLPIIPGERKGRTALLADQLVKRGHEVVWWASAFDHNSKTWHCSYDKTFVLSDQYSIIAVKGCGYGKNISLARMLDQRIIAWKFPSKARLLPRPDMIVASMPTYEGALEAVRFAKRNRIPILVDLRDLWPDIFLDHFPRGFRTIGAWLLRHDFSMLRTVCRQADGLLSMSNGVLNWGLRYAGRPKRKEDNVFYLGCEKLPPENEVPRNKIHDLVPSLQGKFIATFIGAFNTYYDPRMIVECAQACAGDDRIQFVLAGQGELFEKVKAKAGNLRNVLLPGWLNRNEMATLFYHSHVGICPAALDDENHVPMDSVPNKIFTYLAGGLPVISSLRGEMAELIAEEEIGANFDGVEGLRITLTSLVEDGRRYSRMRENAKAIFRERFIAEKVYSAYAEHIERVAADLR